MIGFKFDFHFPLGKKNEALAFSFSFIAWFVVVRPCNIYETEKRGARTGAHERSERAEGDSRAALATTLPPAECYNAICARFRLNFRAHKKNRRRPRANTDDGGNVFRAQTATTKPEHAAQRGPARNEPTAQPRHGNNNAPTDQPDNRRKRTDDPTAPA